ncbi:hypothetical protein GALL_254210 [mine drainage metagenome]|uniref:Uncharacterized protein n=1 Tax=mine drainage metagenome TaxID=410659 RepID=A0A1J5R993_9ZZZZ
MVSFKPAPTVIENNSPGIFSDVPYILKFRNKISGKQFFDLHILMKSFNFQT